MSRRWFVILGIFFALAAGIMGGLRLSRESLQGVSLGNIEAGQRYLTEKDYTKAIAYFNRAVALAPDSFVAHVSLADAYYSISRADLALEEYEVALLLARQNKGSGERYIKDRIEKLKLILIEKGRDGK